MPVFLTKACSNAILSNFIISSDEWRKCTSTKFREQKHQTLVHERKGTIAAYKECIKTHHPARRQEASNSTEKPSIHAERFAHRRDVVSRSAHMLQICD